MRNTSLGALVSRRKKGFFGVKPFASAATNIGELKLYFYPPVEGYIKKKKNPQQPTLSVSTMQMISPAENASPSLTLHSLIVPVSIVYMQARMVGGGQNGKLQNT